MILGNGVRRATLRQIVADQPPAATAVGGFEHIGFVITTLVVVDRRVGHISVVAGCDDVAAVLRNMDQAIIGTCIKQALDQRTLGNRNQRPVE